MISLPDESIKWHKYPRGWQSDDQTQSKFVWRGMTKAGRVQQKTIYNRFSFPILVYEQWAWVTPDNELLFYFFENSSAGDLRYLGWDGKLNGWFAIGHDDSKIHHFHCRQDIFEKLMKDALAGFDVCKTLVAKSTGSFAMSILNTPFISRVVTPKVSGPYIPAQMYGEYGVRFWNVEDAPYMANIIATTERRSYAW